MSLARAKPCCRASEFCHAQRLPIIFQGSSYMQSVSAFRFIAALGLGLGLAFVDNTAIARDFTAGNIVISHPYARATVPGQPTGGAYFSIENKGKETDTLKSISSDVAKSTELHAMTMDGNVMKMREVGNVDIKPSEKIVMHPGDGYHIMLVGLNKPLKNGDQFPMTLTFAKAGKVVVNVDVEAMNAK
jgi:copper(I)-binding protein